jgi:hypothetical protein
MTNKNMALREMGRNLWVEFMGWTLARDTGVRDALVTAMRKSYESHDPVSYNVAHFVRHWSVRDLVEVGLAFPGNPVSDQILANAKRKELESL